MVLGGLHEKYGYSFSEARAPYIQGSKVDMLQPKTVLGHTAVAKQKCSGWDAKLLKPCQNVYLSHPTQIKIYFRILIKTLVCSLPKQITTYLVLLIILQLYEHSYEHFQEDLKIFGHLLYLFSNRAILYIPLQLVLNPHRMLKEIRK